MKQNLKQNKDDIRKSVNFAIRCCNGFRFAFGIFYEVEAVISSFKIEQGLDNE